MYYSKVKKSIYIAVVCITLLLSPVLSSASGGSSELIYNDLFYVHASVSDGSYYVAQKYYSENGGVRNSVLGSLSVNSYLSSEVYSAPLYATGWFGYRISIPVSYDYDTWTASSVNDFIVNCDSVSTYVVNSYFDFSYDKIVLDVFVYLDNAYMDGSRDVALCSCINNISYSLFIDANDRVDDYGLIYFGAPSILSLSYNVKTSVRPSGVSGLGGVISDSVLFGIQQADFNTDLQTMRNLLDTIKTNNVMYYENIIASMNSGFSDVVSVLENLSFDGATIEIDVTEILNSLEDLKQNDILLASQLTTSLQSYFNLLMNKEEDIYKRQKSHLDDKIGQVKFWIQTVNDTLNIQFDDLEVLLNSNFEEVITLLGELVEGNREAASQVASAASSQISALDNMAAELSLSVGDVDSVMGDIDPAVIHETSDMWFWLQGKYSYIVYVLVLSVSLGLVSFILYGKGGR